MLQKHSRKIGRTQNSMEMLVLQERQFLILLANYYNQLGSPATATCSECCLFLVLSFLLIRKLSKIKKKVFALTKITKCIVV